MFFLDRGCQLLECLFEAVDLLLLIFQLLLGFLLKSSSFLLLHSFHRRFSPICSIFLVSTVVFPLLFILSQIPNLFLNVFPEVLNIIHKVSFLFLRLLIIIVVVSFLSLNLSQKLAFYLMIFDCEA